MTITRPITRSILSPLTRAVTAGGGGFAPVNLFAGGIKGIALDLSDMSKLYQDSARTTLVTATGQPIGSPTDLSGNGAHPTQATAASRPTFNGYATFDGTDDSWATPSIDFSGTDKVTIVAGVYKQSDATIGMLLELSATSDSNNGSFFITAPSSNGVTNYRFRSRGTVLADVFSVTAAAGSAHVLSCRGSISTDVSSISVNAGTTNTTATDQGTGNFGNYQLFIGRRAGSSLPFNGRVYRLIVIGRELSASELASAQRWCAAPAGVTLP